MSGGISIVVPTFNRRAALERTLPSLLRQSGVDEIVIVDDGGADGTTAWLRGLADREPRLRPVRLERNQGSPAARNRGLREARGTWILLADDDVILGPDYATRLREHAESRRFDLVSGRRIWLRPGESEPEAELRSAEEAALPPVDTRLLLVNDAADPGDDVEVPLIQALMLGRREVFETVDYDPRFSGNAWREETDFQLTALQRGFRVGLCPHAVCFHLPKAEVPGGGQRARRRLAREWSVVRNNYRLLSKHRGFLAERWPESVPRPLWLAVGRAYVEGRLLDKLRRELRREGR